MIRPIFALILPATLIWIGLCSARADEPAAADRSPAAQTGAAPDAGKPVSTKSPYRPLAPGVLQTINPMPRMPKDMPWDHEIVSTPSAEDTVSRHSVVELLAADPKFDWANDVLFRHDVWVLKFQFKPIRMIWVDVPQGTGRMQRKQIWYMVYSVTNLGKVMHPVEAADLPYDTSPKKQVFEIREEDRPVRFIPEFLLEGHQRMDQDTGFAKVYHDRVIPVALDPIRLREDPNRRFLTSTEMCREIGVDETVWGVATWQDIDPRVIWFSVYVSGLTNAYRWKDEPGEYKEGDPIGVGYRTLNRKVLKLNFWRPGDQYHAHEEQIRYGLPGGVDYEWVYR
jgi:hypothetical protein